MIIGRADEMRRALGMIRRESVSGKEVGIEIEIGIDTGIQIGRGVIGIGGTGGIGITNEGDSCGLTSESDKCSPGTEIIAYEALRMRDNILHCKRDGCENPYGIETEPRKEPCHWCSLDTPSTLCGKDIAPGGTVKEMPPLFPVDLMILHSHLESKVR